MKKFINKLQKIDKSYFLIIFFCLILLYLVIPQNCIFGSKIDWVSQHTVFPDYFRKLFYATKNLFPNYALSLGAGQNIYNFSYYGLLNPLMMLSYLLPNIDMVTYIIFLNPIIYISYGLIQYYFLKSHYNKRISLITTLLLLCASPILFHFHKHFMFVNYLPFLILGLIGIDKIFKTKERYLIVISVFFMVTTSYYYSVCGIVVLGIYAIYKYLEANEKIVIKDMFKCALKVIYPILVGVLTTAVLLLPTFYVLTSGRATPSNINKLELLIPKYNIESILYGNYSMGLTFISLLALIYLIKNKKKENKFLAIVILLITIFPIFIYILNGTLYIRNKILIPFIPLFGVILCQFLDKLLKKQVEYKDILIISIGIILLSLVFQYFNPFIYIDIVILNIIIYCYYKDLTNRQVLSIVIILPALLTLLYANSQDLFMKESFYEKKYDNNNDEIIKNVLKEEKDLVRFNSLVDSLSNVNEVYNTNYNQDSVYSSVSNPLYQDFYKKIFKNPLSYRNKLVLAQNNDVLFQMFMGVKYIYSEKEAPVGYYKISDNVYKSDNVLPMFYGTDKLTNEKLFDGLSYPYNIGTLLNSAVVKSDTTKHVTNNISKVDLDYEIKYSHGITYKETEKYLYVKSSKDNSKVIFHLNEDLNKDILIIDVNVTNTPNCKKGDLRININDISNVLTCKQAIYKNDNHHFHYVISSNEDTNDLTVTFNKGTYHIKSINVYKLKYDDIKNMKNDLSKFKVNKKETIDNVISGTIDMTSNGYFVSSLPYDKGYTVYVDNKKIKTEIVNKAFLGFKLNKGNHKIKIVYTSPLFKEGKYLSLIGLLLFIILLIFDKKMLSENNA